MISPGMKIASADPAGRVHYRSIPINGTKIFYREAGDPGKPVILLLHGFPSSSYMFRNLITWLSSDFRLIAPDYPGFGHSDCPDPAFFSYTFDHLADMIEQLIDRLGLRDISFYMQDYGGPVGFRIITKRPELVKSLIIQNANAYLEGLGPAVQMIGAMTEAGNQTGLEAAVNHMMSLAGIKEQYLFGSRDEAAISPDSYNMDHFFMEQPGRKEVQKLLFQNYSVNFSKYPEWQVYLRRFRPPTLIVWGNNDKIFHGPGAVAYQQDLPDAQIHLFDGGHFLLEEYGNEVSGLIRSFLTAEHPLR